MTDRIQSLADLVSKNALNTLVFQIQKMPGNPVIQTVNGTKTWDVNFLKQAFANTPNPALYMDIALSRFRPDSFQLGSSGTSQLLVFDNRSNRYILSSSGTELNAGIEIKIKTLGADVQIATGLTSIPGSYYYNQYHDGVNFLESAILSHSNSAATANGVAWSRADLSAVLELNGLSSGGYTSLDLAQNYNIQNLTIWEAPGRFGLVGLASSLFTFGLARSTDYTNLVVSSDIVPGSGRVSAQLVLGDFPGWPTFGSNGVITHGTGRLDEILYGDYTKVAVARNLNALSTEAGLYAAGADVDVRNGNALVWNKQINGTAYTVSMDGGAVDGIWTISAKEASSGFTPIGSHAQLAAHQAAVGKRVRTARTSTTAEEVGASLGSQIGVLLGGDNPFAQIAAGTFVGAIGAAFGQWLDYDLAGIQAQQGDTLANSFGEQLGTSFRSVGVSVVSSAITNKLLNGLGVGGFGGQLANVVVSTAISNTIKLGLSQIPSLGFTPPTGGLFTGLNGNIASFFGSQLASLIVSPQTAAAQVLGSLGSTAGAIIFSKVFGSLGNILAPGIGAFVGMLLGTIIGNLFGKKKPKAPTASAETVLQLPYARYELGAITVTNGGNRDLVSNMALAARDSLNGLVSLMSQQAGAAYVSNLGSPTQTYGHSGSQVYVKLSGVQYNVSDATAAVDKGVLWAIRQTNVVGGNIYVKRVITRSTAPNLTVLTGDIQVALDYAKYRANWRAENALIADNPNSAFTAGWIQTFQRVNELGLSTWTPSDFHGGLQGFLGSFDLAGHGTAFENVKISAQGNAVEIQARGQTSDGVFSILPQAIDGASDNDIVNARFQGGLAGWDLGYWQVASPTRGVNLNADWSGSGNDVYWMSMAGTPVTGALMDTRSDWMTAQAGVTYEVTARGAQHRGTAQIYVEFYDANRNLLGASSLSGAGLDYGGSHGDLTTFNLLRTTATAPAGTAYRREVLRLTANGGQNPYAFFTQPTSRVATSAPVDWTVRGEAVRIEDLSTVGYIVRAPGAATSGNDLIDQRLAGAGVTIDDNHLEERWVPDNYHTGQEGYYTTVTANGGDDIFIGGRGNDTLYGRTGWDWLDGGAGNDTLDGGDQNDVLLGGAGNDTLLGGEGDDYLAGGDGSDSVAGGAGADIIVDGQGSEVMQGGDGDDTFLVAVDNEFNWVLGGTTDLNSDPNGKDTLSAERMQVGVSMDLDVRPAEWATSSDPIAADSRSRYVVVADAVTGQSYTRDGVLGIENATGSNFNDRLYGSTGNNVLKGLAGDDELYGRQGYDVLEGGAGADKLYGGATAEVTLSYEGSSAGVYVDLTSHEAFGGDADGDYFENIDRLTGSKLADQLKGDNGSNLIKGLAGDDWLVATGGNDTYDGGEGKDFVDYSEATAAVSLNLGGYTPTNIVNGAGYTGLAANHVYTGVEGVVGSAYADSLSAGDGDQTFVGGAGNDSLYGGAGADTFVLNIGDGADTIVEDSGGWNVLSLGEGIKVSDLIFGTAGGAGGWLSLTVRGGNASAYAGGNFADPSNARVKTIDFNGGGQLDIGSIDYGVGGVTDGADTLVGLGGQHYDLIVGLNGADAIWGIASGQTEQKGNVIIGGLGDDVINTSSGDDQFAYDRGDGVDTITDTGGEDTLVFGSTVAAEDVIYEVVRRNPGSTTDFTADLYIAVKDASDPSLTASSPLLSRIRIVDGGTKYQNYWDDQFISETLNTVEFVIAGGTSIDLRKLDINWSSQRSDNYSNYYPIALDLDGDGLNLSTVDGSSVVVRTAQGGLSKIAWVGPTDGFLAVDRDGDGAINRLSEISFVQDKPGATSDLEGLRTWDTNGDGVLDKTDANFSKILLFVDANQNGRSTAKELRTLEQAGIRAINLDGQATGYTAALTTESFVQNTISFVWADGRTGEGYDVALARRVLGSEGLYAGDYQAEWGARDEDGTLGQLLNDPKTAAKAARIQAKKGLLDKLGASYAEVKAAAQLDFSDHDKVDSAIAKRWTKMDASQRAAWLSGQASGMEGQQNLAGLKAISSDQALRNALNDGAQAGQDLIVQGLNQAGAQVSAGTPGADAAGAQTAATGLGVGFGEASSLGGLAASQPLDGVVVASAAIGQDQAWWRGEAGSGLAGAGSLAALLATMDQGVGQPAPGALSATDDPALLQQQMLLRQAMAGFGGQADGSAAVWNRDAAQASAVLAASPGFSRPTLNLAA